MSKNVRNKESALPAGIVKLAALLKDALGFGIFGKIVCTAQRFRRLIRQRETLSRQLNRRRDQFDPLFGPVFRLRQFEATHCAGDAH